MLTVFDAARVSDDQLAGKQHDWPGSIRIAHHADERIHRGDPGLPRELASLDEAGVEIVRQPARATSRPPRESGRLPGRETSRRCASAPAVGWKMKSAGRPEIGGAGRRSHSEELPPKAGVHG